MDLPGLQRVLRSNGWPSKDPLSPSPWEALSARGDLSPDPEDRDASGAYDCKVRGYEWVQPWEEFPMSVDCTSSFDVMMELWQFDFVTVHGAPKRRMGLMAIPQYLP